MAYAMDTTNTSFILKKQVRKEDPILVMEQCQLGAQWNAYIHQVQTCKIFCARKFWN
jgi:hypothetical protein